MISLHGHIKNQIEERISQCQAAASKIMKSPANEYLIFYRAGLNYILMYKMPTKNTQSPPTEGCISSSAPPPNL